MSQVNGQLSDSIKVSIIIVNYNGAEYLPELFASLGQQSFQDFEIIVVDNASQDDSLKFLKAQKGLKLIESNENLGFAAGNNLGVHLAEGKYVALLNNDTVVDPDWLAELVKALEKDPKRGAAVSKIYLSKPGLNKKVFDSAGSLYNNIGSCWSRAYLEEDLGQYDQEEEVPMGTACSLLFRREILEQTYLFDEKYFMYVEEFDFNLRVRQLGYSIWYVPTSIVHHRTSQTVRQEVGQSKAKEMLYKQRFGNRNRANVLAKYYPAHLLFFYGHLILISFWYWYLKFLIHGGALMTWKIIFEDLKYWRLGWQERHKYVKNYQCWTKFMLHNSLWDLHVLGREISRKRAIYGE